MTDASEIEGTEVAPHRSRLAAPPGSEVSAPGRIGRFEVLARLGEGGMGVVMLARDERLERKLAIKLLRGLGGEPERLFREAQGLARLSHPNVVQVYEIGEHNGEMFIAMEYVDGVTLRGWLAQHARPWRRILDVLVQCGRGLEAAHDAGLVHRDFKPANVMVSGNARARVLDFGLVRADEKARPALVVPDDALERSITVDGALLGTPAYMAPEQLLGRRCDALADQFTYCVVCFEALFGLHPFPGRTLEELRARINSGERMPIPVDTPVPRRVREAILRGLAVESRKRWPSMRELLGELVAAENDASLRHYLRRLGISHGVDPTHVEAWPGEVRPGTSTRVYGRVRALAMLSAAYTRLHGLPGRAGLLVLRGEPGIGKSALAREFVGTLRSSGAVRVAWTKFDQLRRTTPLAGFVELVEALVDELAGEEDGRAKLLARLGPGTVVLGQFVPAVERLLGQQIDPEIELGPVERRNRLRLVLERFFAAAAAPDRPLVLVLDDLQWADPASLDVLDGLLAGEGLTDVILVATLRSDEVAPLDALASLFARRAAVIETFDVEPLSPGALQSLLLDSLGADSEAAARLAAVAYDKTGGNPLHVHQLLQALDDEDLLRFDPATGGWSWSLERIAARPTADDVVSLLAGRVATLGEDARGLLQIAACIGNQCTLADLAAAARRPPLEVLAGLWPALDHALLTVSGEALQRIGDLDSQTELRLGPADAQGLVLRFRHDRIQRTAVAAIDAVDRARIHRTIGEALLRILDDRGRELRAFELTDQLNLGRALLEPEQRRPLIERNLECGRRALRSSSYAAAAVYLGIAAELLDAGPEDPGLLFTVELELARALYLNGDDDAARALYPQLHTHARDAVEDRTVFELELEHAMLRSDHEAAFTACRAAIGRNGLELPLADQDALPLLMGELAGIEAALAGRDIASLAGAPPLTDDGELALLNLLNRFAVLCLRTARPLLLSFGIAKSTSLSLHGSSRLAGYTHSNFAFLLTVQGALGRAGEFAALAVAMARSFGDPAMLARTKIVAHGLIGHVHLPLPELVASLRSALPDCIEAGDLMHASDVMLLGDSLDLASGSSLVTLWDMVGEHLAFMRRSAPVPLERYYVPHVVYLLCGLRGVPVNSLGESFDSEAFMARFAADPLAQAWHLTALTRLEYLRGEWTPFAELERRLKIVEAGAIGQSHLPEVRFYAGLSALAAGRADEHAHVESLVDAWTAPLTPLAAACPANYETKVRLIAAERARHRGAPVDAVVALYERALDAAQAAGALDLEALGSRLYAEFWRLRGHLRSASVHRMAALDLYNRWGATAIARTLG